MQDNNTEDAAIAPHSRVVRPCLLELVVEMLLCLLLLLLLLLVVAGVAIASTCAAALPSAVSSWGPSAWNVASFQPLSARANCSRLRSGACIAASVSTLVVQQMAEHTSASWHLCCAADADAMLCA
jgi:hypothetical protein